MLSVPQHLLADLASRIREIEMSGPAAQKVLPQLPFFAEALPGSQLPAGMLVELLSASEGGGAWTLALLMARQVCAERKLLLICDTEQSFYPPAASRLRIDLERTLLIRPKPKEAVSMLVQCLRCPAVGAAVGKVERLTSMQFRRLQLAAEAGGGLGILVRSAALLAQPSFAAVRLLIAPLPSRQKCRRLQVKIVRLRAFSPPGNSDFLLEIDDEQGDVRVLPSVAAATATAGLSGAAHQGRRRH